MNDKKLQFLFWLKEISYGTTNTHWIIMDCPDGVTDAEAAERHLESEMGDMMAKNDWYMVENYRVTQVGYDLKTPAQIKAERFVSKKETDEKKAAELKAFRQAEATFKEGDSKDVQIQKIILNYFRDIDNATLVSFIESFVYFQTNPPKHVGALLEKFLEDQDLTKAYPNYVLDIKAGKSQIILRSNGSDVDTINKISHALLNVCFNRLRDIV